MATFLILLLSLTCIYAFSGNLPQDPMTEQHIALANDACLRCLCNARTGCLELKNCAKYSIREKYWRRAGRPTVGTESHDSPTAYSNCMQDHGCIRSTIRGYIMDFKDKDCNCDNKIDCKDFLALHLYGDNCHQNFYNIYLRRFDMCCQDPPGVPNTAGWNVKC